MREYLFFLGSNPTLSAVECWTTLRREGFLPQIKLADNELLVVSLEQEIPDDFLRRLGGTDRIAILRAKQGYLWKAEELAEELLSPTPPKLSLGISTVDVAPGYAKKVSFEIKKLMKKNKVRLRFILPQGERGQLNAAQVIFNQLTSPPNKELTVIKNGNEYLLAETLQVQDIMAYEKRDTGRPVRDARVGMLPPKLAQMMLNLVPEFSSQPPVILDPFCGLGTILQEGYLMGYEMIGSDVSERMVEASRRNLESRVLPSLRLTAKLRRASLSCRPSLHPAHLFVHDVRDKFPEDLNDKFDAVATEPDLGEPISTPLPRAKLEARMRESAELYLSFFTKAKSVLKDGSWVVFALPAFRRQAEGKKEEFALFPNGFLDEVKKKGYCLSQLVPKELEQHYIASERGTIIYARPDALVGRELTLWHTRKLEGQRN